MHRRVIRTVVAVLSLSSFALKAADQKLKPSALTGCKAEVDRLKAENADLQKKLNELLMKQLEAMKKPTEAEADALAAVRALASVVDTAGYGDFKKYLLDAKVKIEALPPGSAKTLMATFLDAFLDIGTIWGEKITTSHILMYERELASYEENYPNIRKEVELRQPAVGARRIGLSEPFYGLDDILSYMVRNAKGRAESFSLQPR
jgi:hypothetical protein